MIDPRISEAEWRPYFDVLPAMQLRHRRTVVLAPHPDDETLAVGGLIAMLRGQQVEVTVVAVTDGENAYPGETGLGPVREQEQTAALAALGVDAAAVVRLRLPDSAVAAHAEELLRLVAPLVPEGSNLIAPWCGDFHPDHEACGRAAQALAAQPGIHLYSYLFWTWHRGTPQLLGPLPAASLRLDKQALKAKEKALSCHRSQLQHASGSPILPDNLLWPAALPYEVLIPA